MKPKILIQFIALVLFSLFTISCDEANLSTDPIIYENSPDYSNNPNKFSYALKGSIYTKIENYTLNYTSTNLSIALAVSNRSRGNVIIEILTDYDTVIFTRTINTNTALNETYQFDSLPKKIKLTYDSFTGNVALNVKG